MRLDYARSGLNEADVSADPFEQFQNWFVEAATAGLREPNAMTLATVDAAGAPDARILLLKSLDERGFVFYTNYESSKARQLDAVPRAALVFFWNELERQVRVRGRAERTGADESDSYFLSRPHQSQIAAWVSAQSRIIPDRAWIERRFTDALERFQETVPRPPHWGGYRLIPVEIEFWQGRSNRLHDRLRYRREDGKWVIERLSP